MLQINNLTITHMKDLRYLIRDFSFVLNKGDKVAIIGEEGNGKSTLLKLIYNDNLVKNYIEYTGVINKKDINLGYLPQELCSEVKNKTIFQFCSESLNFYNLTPKEFSNIAFKIGVPTDIFYSNQKMRDLSGGEKVKIQFAKILMEAPNVLLLDEPSNDIDIDTLNWLEKFIKTSKLPILFVSHDETLIENTANVIVHLEQIKRKTICRYTVAKMEYREYVDRRFAKLEHQEQVAKKERDEYKKQQDKFMRIQQKVEHAQKNISRQDPHGGRLLKKKMHVVKSMERRFEKEFENMTEMPCTEDAILVKFNENIKLPKGKIVLDFNESFIKVKNRILCKNIKLIVKGGEKVCIVGKNGVGKTTLLKKISEVLLKRDDIRAVYMPQNYEDMLDYSKTPVEFLTVTGAKDEDSRIRTFLGSMKYTTLEMDHNISELSGGQRAKILFLRMVMNDYNVLILDEPTRNFSVLSNPIIREVLKEFKGTIISVSHDRKFITEVCTTIYNFTENGLVKRL